MLTMISNPEGQHHALNREGTAAICRKNITPYTWTMPQSGVQSATYEVHGEPFRRSVHAHRVTCLGCQRKLAKLTAEAFDAATALQDGTAQAKNLPPVAAGSIMWNALVQVRDYGNGLHVDNRTLDALVRRGLAEAEDNIRYGYRLTDAGVALVGRKIERPDRGSAPAVPYSAGDAVRQSDGMAATVVEVVGDVVTVRAGDGQEYEHAADELEPAVRALKLYDNRRGEAMHLLGQGFGDRGEQCLFFRYENDDHGRHAPRRYVTFVELRDLARFEAVCEHRYPSQGERCLACHPFPNADHLIGERVTLTSADPRQGTGTISGVVARVRPAPLGSAHAVAELESGWLVDLPSSLVEATAPR